jgi:hypothetical protein
MCRKKLILLFLCSTMVAISAAPLRAQTNCTANAGAAVQCFVSNAVAAKLASPRHGLTLAQYQAYGVAVLQILQTHHSYLVLVTTASSVADAMPPLNANGTANQAAQDAAITAIVAAEFANQFVTLPQGTSLQDLEWFAEDVAAPMNDNQGYMQLLTPGAALRLLDSYIVAATTPGAGGAAATVNWQTVETNISNVVDTFTNAGLIKIPAGETSTHLKALMLAVAEEIVTYKTATGRMVL